MEHGFTPQGLDEWIGRVLAEDLGAGDVTANAVADEQAWARMWWEAKSPLVCCGLPVASRFFLVMDNLCVLDRAAEDGREAAPGDVLLEVRGPARALLSAERSALNVAQHLCGVASLTRKFADRIKCTGAKVAATRKTMPLFRRFEKYAVRVGGGIPHRFGLSDGVLIKENHIIVAGSISEAVSRARDYAHHLLRVQVEVTNMSELEEALEAGADLVLLDNMDPQSMRQAVERCQGRVIVEASGNVTLDNVREVAETGVDIISSGSLTHSAPSADISARMERLKEAPHG